MKKFNLIVLSLLLIFCSNSTCLASQKIVAVNSSNSKSALAAATESKETSGKLSKTKNNILNHNATTVAIANSQSTASIENNQTTTEIDNNQTTVNATEIDMGDYQTEMIVGEKQLLSITVLPTDTTDQMVTFQSSNESVATINGMGRITAVSAGTTQITATCGTVQNSFQLTVKKSNDVEVTDIEIGNFEAEMEAGKTQTLSATVLPSNATDATITYQSSDTNIASVLSTGEVKAIAKGTVTITVSAGAISKSIQITVNEVKVIVATEIDLGDYQASMAVGEKQLLSATVLPTDTTDQTLTYQSSNEKVATINELGRIIAVSVGTANITVTCGTAENSFQLTVKKTNDIAVTDIEIGNYEKEMYVDKTQTLSTTVKPSTATDTTVTYSSSNTGVATVLPTGEVKGIGKGTTSITVQAGEISKSIEITVKVATTKIAVNKNYVILKPEDEFKLTASALPSDADQAMTYESTDKDIAIVTASGTISAKSIGTTSILVSNGDLSTAVTVIVNESGDADQATIEKTIAEVNCTKAENLSENEAFIIEKLKNENNSDDIEIDVKDYKVISKNILKALYETGKTIRILGEDYTLILKGRDIVNYENELSTEINIEKEDENLTFLINNSNNLPGLITLKLEYGGYQYLYLYNETKNKYQQLKMDDLSSISLDITGKYMLTQDKLSDISISIIVIILVVVILFGLVITYIAVKKQYWFW
ncbi:Ig-like domain-containing protein [Lachnotalea glycerini]|uniref:BIG2 domain-containing protein n=1 Tax=Lachnotalea glycerini TaxID=1763509 RepID=A0A371JDT5_9FIRM|nr:Ig-like domain-containing protein [Lachnotalea glycerini]RDY30882.1 hypothetical protein CG710_012480 [Lachnotalea glycerini]